VVWVGLDDDSPLRLAGSTAAAPIWRELVAAASPARPPRQVERPADVVDGWLDPETGRRVRASRPGARPELFRRGAQPPHRRIWRADPPLPVVR
jgi:membrane carboxypeptidase/penicillin-binding protein